MTSRIRPVTPYLQCVRERRPDHGLRELGAVVEGPIYAIIGGPCGHVGVARMAKGNPGGEQPTGGGDGVHFREIHTAKANTADLFI